jgi:hypothetical protein
MLTMLKDYSISIKPFIDTLLTVLGILNHPSLGSSAHLSPKYQNEINVLPNIEFCCLLLTPTLQKLLIPTMQLKF